MSQLSKVRLGVAVTMTAAAARMALDGVDAARRRATSGPPARRGAARDVHTLTVTVPPEQLLPGAPALAPLDRFGDAVQVTVRPAPADRGSQVHVRLVGPDAGDGRGGQDAASAVRAALREVRALAEIGFVPSPDRPTTTWPTTTWPTPDAPPRATTSHRQDGGRR
ncbi:MAG TPA: hypothetical protein VI248_07835 [Kineosporiaceae bacterium]